MLARRQFPRVFKAILLLLIGLGPECAAQEQRFVETLTPEEWAEIGLKALTPEQIAALEAAVQRFAAGRSQEAVSSATEEVRSTMTEELTMREAMLTQTRKELEDTKSALQEKETEEKGSFLDRARVILRPGTRVEYSRLESRLADPFKGWQKGTLLHLENGQIWQVTEGTYRDKVYPPGLAVTVVPGVLGSFFIEVEGVAQRARVKLVSN